MPSGWGSIQEPRRAIASYIGENAGSSRDGESIWTNALRIMEIVGPAILLIVLIWLVMRRRSDRTANATEAGTRDLYREEEQRRREGTDDL